MPRKLFMKIKAIKACLLFTGLCLVASAWNARSDIPGYDKELGKVRDKFKAARILRQDDLELLKTGSDWTCSGYSATKVDFLRSEPQKLYHFDLQGQEVLNTGLSGIRKFAVTDKGLAGTLGENYITYLRMTKEGELMGELTLRNINALPAEARKTAIADQERLAATYAVCKVVSNTPPKGTKTAKK